MKPDNNLSQTISDQESEYLQGNFPLLRLPRDFVTDCKDIGFGAESECFQAQFGLHSKD